MATRSLEFRPGVWAIIGATGSGKTSVLRAIMQKFAAKFTIGLVFSGTGAEGFDFVSKDFVSETFNLGSTKALVQQCKEWRIAGESKYGFLIVTMYLLSP